ncbi:MAG: hypothetical protein DI535_05345 [Citrobacter freundii]|nr:MAG: hypothetical protein DI535_05345 [Citrobacter freundii]
MRIQVASVNINNEMDVVLAHRRAMQIARFAGIGLSEQTRFATAVSEICRNCLEYANEGVIHFNAESAQDHHTIEAEIIDKGNGITGLDKILQRDPYTYRGRGLGIIFARRLSDNFQIKSSKQGTTVSIRKNIHGKKTPFSKLVIDGWRKHLRDEPMLSAYEELKIRNSQLHELTEELREQKEQIEHLNVRLRQSNQNMQEFTFAISHDLKTPLTSLKLSLSLLKPDEHQEKLAEVISRSVNRLDKTIHGLIDILHIQNPERQVVANVRFPQLLQEVEEDFKALLQETRANIHREFKVESIPYIEGYVKSIMMNLLSNSIKYRSAKPLEISIQTIPVTKGVRLTYTDNGIGIDLTKNKANVFKPFRRLTTVSEGKGIGLYIIKTMVENNGGSVQIKSQPGEGTTFVFDLVRYE